MNIFKNYRHCVRAAGLRMKEVRLRALRANNPAFSFNLAVNMARKAIGNGGSPVDTIDPALSKPLLDILRRIRLTIETRTHEINGLFSKATEELNSTLKKNERRLTEKIDTTEKAAAEIFKKARNHGILLKTCMSNNQGELNSIKSTFVDAARFCNEETLKSLETHRSRYEGAIDEAKILKFDLKNTMKTCLSKKENVNQCLKDNSVVALKRYNSIIEKLKTIPKSADENIVEIMKNAAKCHSKVQMDASRSLKKVLADAKACVDKSAHGEKPEVHNLTNAAQTTVDYPKTTAVVLIDETKSALAKKGRSSENLIPDEKLQKCLDKAAIETKVIFDILAYEMSECAKMASNHSLTDYSVVQYTHRRGNNLLEGLKEIVRSCSHEDKDVYKCFTEKFKSLKFPENDRTRASQLSDPDAAEVDEIVECYKKSIVKAQTKLAEIEKSLTDYESKSTK